ncbi:NUDIX hydrolase [Celeribacter sp.]|uniref:NUDIX hydrolase n=1 Tax=Celeribacter sp. TaxID=1890673 RepID=UPI003A919B6F
MMFEFDGSDFDGAKIAILRGADVLTLLRDDFAHIPFPNHWDLPGGGREGIETPLETAARELAEELGLVMDPARFIYARKEAAYDGISAPVYFFVARWEALVDSTICLGDEGQDWRWMGVTDFLAHPMAVPPLKDRLRRYVDDAAML